VVFDLDGVIVDSEPTHELANARYFATLGPGVVGEELLDEMMGRRVRDLTDAVAERLGRDADEVFAAREAVFWPLLAEGLEPMPELPRTLERLRAAGLTLAVASSGTRDYVEHVLDMLGVVARFAGVVTGDDVTRAKPDPAIYRLAAERLGLPPAACAAVEDAPNGVCSAVLAGMRAVAVPGGRTAGMDFPGAEAVVDSLDAAADHLLGRF
jgi:HAD superfamily hydrolase (TIGR01509 family)